MGSMSSWAVEWFHLLCVDRVQQPTRPRRQEQPFFLSFFKRVLPRSCMGFSDLVQSQVLPLAAYTNINIILGWYEKRMIDLSEQLFLPN
jgi:hypothetical protein